MATIDNLPDEILEFIFSHMPPYKDLESCELVCKRWTHIVKNVRRHTQLNFHKSLVDFRLCWKSLNCATAPTIAGRYSHSAIIHANSMFVFGGGSSTETTFNDLWRFDLSSREWIRPISMGAYPSPKACASMVCYKGNLILFGGWRHPSTFPPYQPWRLFDELHSYSIADNKWYAMTPHDGPPPMTGHSATVHRGKMIVFGGYCGYTERIATVNDVWSLDLSTFLWKKKETNNVKPAARYGQFQIQLDEDHLLILGGCGGPNNMFNDAWVLDMTREPWIWRSIAIRNRKWAASHMWCNPACKVGSKLVVLGPVASASSDFQIVRHQVLPNVNRNNFMRANDANEQPAVVQPPPPPRPPQNHQQRPNNRVNHSADTSPNRRANVAAAAAPGAVAEASEQSNRSNNAEDDAVNRLQRNLQLRSRRQETDDFNLPRRFGEHMPQMPDRMSMAAFNVHHEPASNSRRLQSLRRAEEKIHARRQQHQPPEHNDEQPAPTKRIKRNCIGMFICDIANVLHPIEPFLEWQEHKNSGHIINAPERLILSSLVTGNGELIMFGGLRKESLSKISDTNMQVSNAMHFLRVPREII